ncbi:UDP-N-acetylmuramate:L-alanine ligase [Escherichia coli]|nr:UDP-N-acetylmuramate:L-alanine ligase [Escherichia coli]
MRVTLNAPGRHNPLNAAAAVAVSTEKGIDDRAIFGARERFQGCGGRLQLPWRIAADAEYGERSAGMLW